MAMLIKGARVIDPGHLDEIRDVLVADGRIAGIFAPGQAGPQDAAVRCIDARGKILSPGLIDMHVHLREPGAEHKETIASGCRAAACGGFTGICPMPNTDPVNDSRQVTAMILNKASAAGLVRVYPVAAISRGLNGLVLCDYPALRDAGVVAVSDDGRPVSDSHLMRKALEAAGRAGLMVISHCEVLELARDGAVNEGPVAGQLGVKGVPNAAESIMVMRDIALAELTGKPVHIAHVSTAESVRAIGDAKARGIKVTAETAPHYFSLTDAAVVHCGANAKMNPPLRSAADRDAVCRGLADGTLDAIATDHAPHSRCEKDGPLSRAANGVIGLETSLPLGLKLVEDGVLTLSGLIEKMSTNPARILGLEAGIRPGLPADLTLIDPDCHFTVDAAGFASLSRNTPFDGWRLKGRAAMTVVGGKVVFDAAA